MNKPFFSSKPAMLAMALALTVPVVPLAAQATGDGAAADVRLRKLEAEIAALQRQVFPGGDGKYFAPQLQPGTAAARPAGTPASSPVTDLLARMDAVEGQLARLTAQQEESGNKLAQLEAKLAALTASGSANAAVATLASPATGATTGENLSVMAGTAPAPTPAANVPAAAAPAAAPAPVVTPSAPPAPTAAKPATTPAAKPAAPSAQRLAAVKAVEKPATADAGDDEYSYGFRLWEKKFYPEAQQQLKLYLQNYPKHGRVSYARNLLGRAYLDDGNPREAASWFLQNYQANKKGDRAADSLLYLADAMRQLKDSTRACVALAQFADDYPSEAAGRLKAQYDATKSAVKCN